MGFFADPIYGGKSRHGRLEDDRVPGIPIQLSGLGEPAQRTFPAPACQHDGPGGMDTANALRTVHGQETPEEGRGDHRAWMDRIHHGQ